MSYEDQFGDPLDFSDYRDSRDNHRDNSTSQYNREHHQRALEPRREPQLDGKHNPSLGDIYALLGAMQRQLDTIESIQASHARAFTKNDLGEPDYDGHRTFHSKSNKTNENLEKYKTSLTKSLLEWIMKGGIAVMGLGLVSLIGTRFGDLIK